MKCRSCVSSTLRNRLGFICWLFCMNWVAEGNLKCWKQTLTCQVPIWNSGSALLPKGAWAWKGRFHIYPFCFEIFVAQTLPCWIILLFMPQLDQFTDITNISSLCLCDLVRKICWKDHDEMATFPFHGGGELVVSGSPGNPSGIVSAVPGTVQTAQWPWQLKAQLCKYISLPSLTIMSNTTVIGT